MSNLNLGALISDFKTQNARGDRFCEINSIDSKILDIFDGLPRQIYHGLKLKVGREEFAKLHFDLYLQSLGFKNNSIGRGLFVGSVYNGKLLVGWTHYVNNLGDVWVNYEGFRVINNPYLDEIVITITPENIIPQNTALAEGLITALRQF